MSAILKQTALNKQPLPIAATCSALSISRSTLRRYLKSPEPSDKDIDLRDRIQRVALKRSVYGYRRITKELKREGLTVNHKRVLRVMREDNLLCLRKRRFVKTTNSEHALPIYPNLVPGMTLTGIDQLWVSDITYIRLGEEFVYLAVILDAFSRRLIGWEIGRQLASSLTVSALQMAIRRRNLRPGLVHHSDRGVQYASKEYTNLLMQRGITISMSRRGNPYDNARAESFMKTLKYEEVYLADYQNLPEARRSIGRFLEDVYNHKRLHSAIGYLPPAEFESMLAVK